MCLALIGKVLNVTGDRATVEFEGVKREASAEFIRPQVGDRVMVLNDFILEKVE